MLKAFYTHLDGMLVWIFNICLSECLMGAGMAPAKRFQPVSSYVWHRLPLAGLVDQVPLHAPGNRNTMNEAGVAVCSSE